MRANAAALPAAALFKDAILSVLVLTMHLSRLRRALWSHIHCVGLTTRGEYGVEFMTIQNDHKIVIIL
jgi:hypothetical protein